VGAHENSTDQDTGLLFLLRCIIQHMVLPNYGEKEHFELSLIAQAKIHVSSEEYMQFLQFLMNHSVAEVSVDSVDNLGTRLLFRLPEEDFDTNTISLREFQYVQKHLYPQQHPSVISTTTFNKLQKPIPEEYKLRDAKKAVVAVQRNVFLDRCTAVLQGTDTDISGKLTIGFIRIFLGYYETKISK